MTERAHRMPFGAEIGPDGAVRFRLWAPAAKRVELLLYEAEASRTSDGLPARGCDRRLAGTLDTLPARTLDEPPAHTLDMEPAGGGWIELVTPLARAGTLYRYRIDGSLEVPDPTSRFNPRDVGGPSEVVDPTAFSWPDDDWRAPPWHEAVLYELHAGAFTPEGTFQGIERELDRLAALGVTALELLPVADFPGRRGWGYDGVLPYAPDAVYGTPSDLKSLISAAHGRGLAVMLDVVYNHFGPEGNFLGRYAPQFFSERHRTPWGTAIDFDGKGSRIVRDFFVHNALYWLEEYHLDGLRLDAVHAIHDASRPHILTEIARAVRSGPGRSRPIYLVLEKAASEARFLDPPGGPETFDAQWNDDVHHCLHVMLTGETDGRYRNYADRPSDLLRRALAQGFAHQGEHSRHRRRARGESCAHLPPTAFVNFLQNHDQVGNRARGERLSALVSDERALAAAAAVVLLAPSPPMLFMGEEYAASQPFPYFCDFGPRLAAEVRAGRRREHSHPCGPGGADVLEEFPDPADAATARSAQLDLTERQEPQHARTLEDYRRLLALRRREIVPLVPDIRSAQSMALGGPGAFLVEWTLASGGRLCLVANLADRPAPAHGLHSDRVIYATDPDPAAAPGNLQPWSVTWLLAGAPAFGLPPGPRAGMLPAGSGLPP